MSVSGLIEPKIVKFRFVLKRVGNKHFIMSPMYQYESKFEDINH